MPAMARGYDKHQERIEDINLLGKDLARRAKRRCELCEGDGCLRPHDTAPDDEPTLDTLALLCARCREVATGGRHDERELRFLEGAVWHELPVIASLAKQLLADVDADWARDTLEMLD